MSASLFTLIPGDWYALEMFGDEHSDMARSYSPIRVNAVEPLRTGGGELVLTFFHANYPQGVQIKTYRLRVLQREDHFIVAKSLQHEPTRLLLVRAPTWAWLEEHFGLSPGRPSPESSCFHGRAMHVTPPPLNNQDNALEVLRLRDKIFSDLSGRGVQMEPLSCRRDGGGTIVRFAHGGLNLAGACIRFRDGDRRPTVVTVVGPSDGWSRSWQRRRDGSFDVVGIADYVVSMIEHERAQPSAPELDVPSGVHPSTSGLYALLLAAVRLRASATATTPEELLGGIGDARGRAVVARRLERGGLKEADLRRLARAASVHLYRPNDVDFDPFEPQGRNVLPIALVGRATREGIETRYVLVLDYGECEVLVADPAGQGLMTLGREAFLAEWRLAERRGLRWVGLVSPAARSRQP